MSEREPLRTTRRTALKWGALAAATPALSGLPLDAFASGDSVVLLWNDAALQGVRDSTIGPPMVARALAIVHTSIFDFWAAYGYRAVGTRLGSALRRPPRERTLANMNAAISFAAYRAAVDLFPGDRASVFDPLMRHLGYDPANTTDNITTPEGVGNVAARAVLEFRRRDGANQLGDEPGGKPGVAYADYTGYTSANDPMDLRPGVKSDDFGASVTFPAGSSRFESGAVPATDVTLRWATFRGAANQAGFSRRYGGIHFEQGDLDARSAGRRVARQAWAKVQGYISGTRDDRDRGDENDDRETD